MKISGLWIFTELEPFKKELLKLDKRKCYKFILTDTHTITCKLETFIKRHIDSYKDIKVLENRFTDSLIMQYIGE